MNTSMFSDAQWDWIAARRKEGYALRELADFLGVSHTLIAVKMRDRIPALPPLETRKAEFNALWDKEQL